MDSGQSPFFVDLVDGDGLVLGVPGLVEVDPQGLVEEILVKSGWALRRERPRGGGRQGQGDKKEKGGTGLLFMRSSSYLPGNYRTPATVPIQPRSGSASRSPVGRTAT